MLLSGPNILYGNKILSEKLILKIRSFRTKIFNGGLKFSKKISPGEPKFSVKKLVQGPKFSGPKFQ